MILHPGDLVTVHSRIYRVLFQRGAFVTVRDDRTGRAAHFNVVEMERAA